ncbi:MAG: type II toxin-antitoxin system VapC family toxin [Cytophagales bacterium]|nr:type II toxin-antitoxin system VapC family toxin [Cytophagales bacterium]
MIVLDTNVISEVMRPAPDPLVLAWLNRQARTSLYLCSTVWSELLTGIELMPISKRKTSLGEVLSVFRGTLIETPMLMFDEQAAVLYAKLVAISQKRGVQISVGDAQIAAMALQHGMAVATRDEAPFLAAGVQVICPWSEKD